MNIVKHRDKRVSVTLSPDEARKLFLLVRQGRIALVREHPDYDSTCALDFLRAVEQPGPLPKPV